MPDLRERYGALAESWLSGQASAHVPWTKEEPDDKGQLLSLLLQAGALAAEECGERIHTEFVRENCRALAAELRGES